MFETVLRLISSIVKINLLAYCLLCCLFLLKETPYTFGLFYSFSFQRSTLLVALFQQLLYLNRLPSECQQLFWSFFISMSHCSSFTVSATFINLPLNQPSVNYFFKKKETYFHGSIISSVGDTFCCQHFFFFSNKRKQTPWNPLE